MGERNQMTHGKCPKCDHVLSHVKLDYVEIKVTDGKTFHGANYLCPYCRTVLSVAIDPIALKAEIVFEVVKKLQS
jgi:uncharacterized protein with PIN domain